MIKNCVFNLPVAYIDEPNLNGRTYTQETASHIIRQFKEKQPMYGNFSFDSSMNVYEGFLPDLSKATHMVKSISQDMSYSDGEVISILSAEIEIMDNEYGKMAMSNIDNLTLSLRGTGMLKPIVYIDSKTSLIEGEHLGYEVKDYNLITIDLILKKESSFHDKF